MVRITMEPVSARLPSDLYLWLAGLEMEGAPTNSDKVRELLAQVKRQYDGAFDYAAAHAWVRDLMRRLTDSLVKAEIESGRNSELLSGLLEHVTALLALVISSRPAGEAEAAQMEDALVRRVFSMANLLLRQAATTQAAAFDPQVVRRHVAPTLELAGLLNAQQGVHHG